MIEKINFEYNDVLKKLADSGYNTTRIRNEKIISEKTLFNIRHNKDIRLSTLLLISKLTNVTLDKLVIIKKEMKNMKIEYEVEKNIDKEGGVYFKTLNEAKRYFLEQIDFCKEQKSINEKDRCDDFDLFDSIQINKIINGGEEIEVIKSYTL